MKRKDISTILLSEISDDEKVTAILNLSHTELDELRDSIDEKQREAERLTAELNAAKQAQTDAEHALEDFKTQTAQEKTRGEKSAAVKNLLKEAGIDDKRLDTVMRVINLDDYTITDGEIADKDTKLSEIKNAWSDFIPTVSGKGAQTQNPPETKPYSYSRTDISKMSADEINKNWEAVKASLKSGE